MLKFVRNFLFDFCFILETWSHYVFQLALKSQSSCPSLPSAGIIGTRHHSWLTLNFDFNVPLHHDAL